MGRQCQKHQKIKKKQVYSHDKKKNVYFKRLIFPRLSSSSNVLKESYQGHRKKVFTGDKNIVQLHLKYYQEAEKKSNMC